MIQSKVEGKVGERRHYGILHPTPSVCSTRNPEKESDGVDNDKVSLKNMRWVLFATFVGLFVVIAAATIWTVFFTAGGLSPDDRSLLVRVFLGEVGIAVVALFYAVFGLKRGEKGEVAVQSNTESTVASASENPPFFVKSYPRSQHPEFFAEVEALVPQASRITLIAVGLNLIWEKHIVDLLLRRAMEGQAEITICMGNTDSPHIEDRLIEEEMAGNRPQVGRQGVDRNVRALVERAELAGSPKGFRVTLFDHYPTFASLVFDDDIFIYPYGYQVLGNTSPIFHLKDNGSDVTRFFLDNAERIIRDSVPATDIINVRRNPGYSSQDWIGAAVFAIPHKDSALYKFGSSVLGYDIRTGSTLKAPKDVAESRRYVGEAAKYGFHLTVADALMFVTEAQIDRIRAELRFLAADFRPFVLEGLHVLQSPHDPRAVIILAEERSGSAEAIHHELVARVYSTAISSNYRSGRTGKAIPRDDRRTQLMLDKYGSPFILGSFKIHLTLCSETPDDQNLRSELIRRLDASVQALPEKATEIGDLALVVKRPGEEYWTIEESFPLSGPRRS